MAARHMVGGPFSQAKQQAPSSQYSPKTTRALPGPRRVTMKSMRTMGTGCESMANSQVSRCCPSSVACSVADRSAAASCSHHSRHISCVSFLKVCGRPSLLNPPHELHSTLVGTSLVPGSHSSVGRKYNRISKSKSTHSWTMQLLAMHPGCVSESKSRDANWSWPSHMRTKRPSHDQPSLTTPFLMPSLLTSDKARSPGPAGNGFLLRMCSMPTKACQAARWLSASAEALETCTAAGSCTLGSRASDAIQDLEVTSS
mmetsp:Transcript_18958/g.56673  ORF Transcript_18958/g.56673 Transcript_18958/m.56673 type:complete len:257 (+) Transcript_18958:96-866(+)